MNRQKTRKKANQKTVLESRGAPEVSRGDKTSISYQWLQLLQLQLLMYMHTHKLLVHRVSCVFLSFPYLAVVEWFKREYRLCPETEEHFHVSISGYPLQQIRSRST